MIKLGYLFTSDSVDRQVDHRIYILICVAVKHKNIFSFLLSWKKYKIVITSDGALTDLAF